MQEKIDALNEKLERECCGSGERSLPPGDIVDCVNSKDSFKPKGTSIEFSLILRPVHIFHHQFVTANKQNYRKANKIMQILVFRTLEFQFFFVHESVVES